MSWLAPFVTLAVVLVLYFVSGKEGPRQAAMRADINFYLVCVMAVAIISIVAGARYGRDWLDVGAWIMAGIASAAALWRWRNSEQGADGD